MGVRLRRWDFSVRKQHFPPSPSSSTSSTIFSFLPPTPQRPICLPPLSAADTNGTAAGIFPPALPEARDSVTPTSAAALLTCWEMPKFVYFFSPPKKSILYTMDRKRWKASAILAFFLSLSVQVSAAAAATSAQENV